MGSVSPQVAFPGSEGLSVGELEMGPRSPSTKPQLSHEGEASERTLDGAENTPRAPDPLACS